MVSLASPGPGSARLATFHPGAVLCARDRRHELQAALTDDLRVRAKRLNVLHDRRSA
jgi:hypothetical protein